MEDPRDVKKNHRQPLTDLYGRPVSTHGTPTQEIPQRHHAVTSADDCKNNGMMEGIMGFYNDSMGFYIDLMEY